VVTAGTYQKQPVLRTDAKLELVHDALLVLAGRYGWALHAWAVLPNHYHFVGVPEDAKSLAAFVRHLHSDTARRLNRMHSARGRRVWYQYWDTQITFENSYMARLKYVHWNPVKHGLVRDPLEYKWCSAAWFRANAPAEMVRAVGRFSIERLKVMDDF
jgi:putative transposase